MSLATRLYRGETNYDVVGRRKVWYTVAAVLILLSLAMILLRGFNFGIEFRGGASFQFEGRGATVADVRETVEGAGVDEVRVQRIGSSQLRVQTEPLSDAKVDEVFGALSGGLGIERSTINDSAVGPAWGAQITSKALQGLAAFLVAVVIFLSLRFEPKMAMAAIAALFHDLIVTAGIYSLLGFEVTPSTVIGLLTILGYSLYDTVVVFDKVEENTRGLAGGSRSTYTQATNLAVNQTLMRSINTTLIALLPVGGLLFVGAGLLGAGTLKELALVLFVGMAAGAYSSICLSTPLLADLKEREPQYRALRARVASRGSGAAPARSGAAGRPGTATRPAPSRTATAVLDREEEPLAQPDGVGDAEPIGVVSTGGSVPMAGRPRRPQPQHRRKGGRPGRPSGKRRR